MIESNKTLNMSNKEAADILRTMLNSYQPPRANGKSMSELRMIVALNKAIKALEKEDYMANMVLPFKDNYRR